MANRSPATWDWFRRKSPAVIDVDWDTSASRATYCSGFCWWKRRRSRCAVRPSGAGHSSTPFNANEGTDFLQVQAATNLEQFLIAVGQTIVQVRATNPPARMQALAKQIIAASPALVSLQELDQWSTGLADGSST